MKTFQQNRKAVIEQKLNTKEVAKPVDKSDTETVLSINYVKIQIIILVNAIWHPDGPN